MATWKIEIDREARRDLEKLDPQVTRRIERFLFERVATLEDPRSIGEALKGSKLGNFWKYRVGDYRIICDIQDKKVVILVLRVGHRSEIYDR
jgi:mRNA interferase RelE/StbE